MFGNIKVISPTMGVFRQVYRKDSGTVKSEDFIWGP